MLAARCRVGSIVASAGTRVSSLHHHRTSSFSSLVSMYSLFATPAQRQSIAQASSAYKKREESKRNLQQAIANAPRMQPEEVMGAEPAAASSSASLLAPLSSSQSSESSVSTPPSAKRQKTQANLLVVGAAGRSTPPQSAAAAAAASSSSNNHSPVAAADHTHSQMSDIDPTPTSTVAASITPLQHDVWADESSTTAQPSQTDSVQTDSYSLILSQSQHRQQQDEMSAVSLSQSSQATYVHPSIAPPLHRPDLFAGGAPVPIIPASFTQPQQFSHQLQPHLNPWTARAAMHNVPVRHGSSASAAARRGGRGGGGGRAIRGPHRVPSAHEFLELENDPPLHPTNQHSSQLENIWNAPRPAHGHPPAYYAAAAAASSSSNSIDLTQDHDTLRTVSSITAGNEEDVQVIGSYNPFGTTTASSSPPIPAYQLPSFAPPSLEFDPYAAAFRNATSSGFPYSPSPEEPTKQSKPMSATQFAALSKEQQAVVLAIRKGENIFFSGCAGTGKSHLLKLLAQFLPKRTTFFTASTGLAAVNIGGSTLHSFAGVGLGDGLADKLAAKARGNRQSQRRWLECKVLVVDEVSMISGTFFDKLETVARLVRGNDEPFGGIQLVLSGDFLQLPPVRSTIPTFRAECWEKCIKRRIVLTKVFRQEGDPFFINLLANLRQGKLELKEEASLKKSHFNQLPPVHGVIATKLNSLKRDTADENEKHLQELEPFKTVYFKAIDTGPSQAHIELLQKNCPASDILKLKKGAQVMLLKNLSTEEGLCNGSRGIIIDFVKVHGDESMNGGLVFSSPQEKKDLIGLSSNTTSVEPTYYDQADNNGANHNFGGRVMEQEAGLLLLPRVQFDNGVVRVIESDVWSITIQDVKQAERRQIPLTLAWALTIHKSQGMTLDRAEIQAQGIFENGQLYVAVSRVKSLQGLRLLNFTRDTMRTDMAVVTWYKKLEAETATSTAELLSEVENFFPELDKQLEEERIKNIEDEERMKRLEEIKRQGPFAQARAAAAAAAASSSTAAAAASSSSSSANPIIISPTSSPKPKSAAASSSSGFVRASSLNLYGSGSNGTTKRESAHKPVAAPARPPAKPFRSPLKNPVAAAIANAQAESLATGVDIVVPNVAASSVAPLVAATAAPPPTSSSELPSTQHASSGRCCVCTTERADHIIFDCMHLCLCADCHDNFKAPEEGEEHQVKHRCPMCQQTIRDIRKIYTA